LLGWYFLLKWELVCCFSLFFLFIYYSFVWGSFLFEVGIGSLFFKKDLLTKNRSENNHLYILNEKGANPPREGVRGSQHAGLAEGFFCSWILLVV
jgi:hypothetical protein